MNKEHEGSKGKRWKERREEENQDGKKNREKD